MDLDFQLFFPLNIYMLIKIYSNLQLQEDVALNAFWKIALKTANLVQISNSVVLKNAFKNIKV